MNYIFRGKLAAELCDDCILPLSYAKFNIYRALKGDQPPGTSSSTHKDSLRFVNDALWSKFEDEPIGSATIGENGEYKIEVDPGKTDYNGGAVFMTLEVSEKSMAKYARRKETGDRRVVLSSRAMEFEFEDKENGQEATWNAQLPSRLWCALLSRLDYWIICGTVIDCNDRRKTRIPHAIVSVFDADWLKDDALGTVTADGNGRFRLIYRSIDFKQTFLSPLVNAETPFSRTLGPDVYFKVERNGVQLLDEKRRDGCQKGRRDIDNCFCIELCVDAGGGDDPAGPTDDPDWTHIGADFMIPIGGQLKDFDPDGFAGTERNVLTGHVNLCGEKEWKNGKSNYRYRVYAREALPADQNGSGTEATFTDADILKSTGRIKVGALHKKQFIGMGLWAAVDTIEVWLETADIDADGWIDLEKLVRKTLDNTPGYSQADLTNTNIELDWQNYRAMFAINTLAFAPRVVVPKPVPGEKTVGSIPEKRIAIRFEAEELPVGGPPRRLTPTTMNSLVINNSPSTLSLGIRELLDIGSKCDPISGTVHLAYSAFHPYLRNVSLSIRSNKVSSFTALKDNGHATRIPPADADMPLVSNTSDSVQHMFNRKMPLEQQSGGFFLPEKCTHLVQLSVQRRLHDGYNPVPYERMLEMFYFDAPSP